MVRQAEARSAQGVSQAQIVRELNLSMPMLHSLVRMLTRQPERPVPDVLPSQGRIPSDQYEPKRLESERHRLREENIHSYRFGGVLREGVAMSGRYAALTAHVHPA
jgi:hypothetical protein